GPGCGGAEVPRPGPAAGGAVAVLLRRHPHRKLGAVGAYAPACAVGSRGHRARIAGTGHRGDDPRGAGRGAAWTGGGAVAGRTAGPQYPGRRDPRGVDADLLDGADPAARLLATAARAARGR